MSPLDPITGMPSLAVETELSLNYFNNFFRTQLFRRGKDYVSFGNEFVQTDIEGVNVSDRIRLFDNRTMTSLSYETKWNNVQNDNSEPTTTYNTFNASITAFPGVNIPTFTLGYGFNTRKNSISLHLDTLVASQVDTTYPSSKIDSLNVADEITNRYFASINYNFFLIEPQTFNATISIANKVDNTFYLRNQDNLSFSTSLLTSFKQIPLQTTIAINVSHNVSYSAIYDTITQHYLNTKQNLVYNYQTVSLSARYRMMNERLNLAVTLAPSFGDFKRFLIQAGVDYRVMDNHYLVGQLDLIQNSGRPNDVMFSVVYRFMF